MGAMFPNLGRQKLKEKEQALKTAYLFQYRRFLVFSLYLHPLKEFLYAGSLGKFGNSTYNFIYLFCFFVFYFFVFLFSSPFLKIMIVGMLPSSEVLIP